MQCLKYTLFLALLFIPEPTPATKGDIVKTWARNLGEELWKLSESLTKSDQIRIKYKQMNASVKKKDGKSILESSLRSVATMLTRKINAVKCIHATAEELAQNFTYVENPQNENLTFEYCSAKYSQFSFQYPEDKPTDLPKEEEYKFLKDSRKHYMNVSLEKDSHFYNISVNTNMSCVHVPTNIFYREKNALNAILWSESLDDIFIKNYKSDPSLSWQYFGSAHGILRFYPGMPWNKMQADTYDCRVQSWYIEAATCSKDVIILFDVSGSMTGFKNYVARRTLRSLLDTLSNNDYVNVFYFKKEVGLVIECFKTLVQATKENIYTIRDKLEPWDDGKEHNYKLEGNANLTEAYRQAFLTLRHVRNKNKCNLTSEQGCNQLVMVITDYVPGNLTKVFEEYNREVVDNKTYIPVRVFTYLIGKEVTNVQEIQWMACLNRGYFVHIHSVEEVQQQVLKYINVIARPMILEGTKPPPTWTHANIDHTRTIKWNVSNDIKNPDEDKLVTSVAIPAFDYYTNQQGGQAMLLGVAGTDVPIDSIAKLAKPHQLGVNGYSFIVSNNGYLLLHPLLITTINGALQDNYNSVDFVEVEQVDDGKASRELGKEIQELRSKLVNGIDGNMTNIPVLYHYDQMRRIARVKHDYFFHELEGTPFSMGISLPVGYGNTELLLNYNPLEAKQGQDLVGINVTDYFRNSYRVHPDWVYCKYHYLEGHENVHPEHEIFKFLANLSRNKLNITKQQYEYEKQEKNFTVQTHCGDATQQRDVDDYYCIEDLVKQLVFDAKLTAPYFEEWHATEREKALAEAYNVSVRFVATSSGLTRWHYIFDDDKNEMVLDDGMRVKKYTGTVFGDQYVRSIEETWYKAAVLQHSKNDVESLVISTPLLILDEIIKQNSSSVQNKDGDIVVTASYAIFYKDDESETPASVVGFEFLYSSFYQNFLKITETGKEWSEGISCKSSKYECYVVDSSGYIVLSREKDHVGKFFGVINKYVLHDLVQKKIFEFVEVFNYQALCPWWMRTEKSCSNPLFSPFTMVKNLLVWLFTEAVILTSNLYNWSDNVYAASISDDIDYYDNIHQAHTEAPATTPAPPPSEKNKTKKDRDKPFSCDNSIHLYILNQSHFLSAARMGAMPLVGEDESSDCHPAYWATLITKTNLLMVVVENTNRTFASDCQFSPDTTPRATAESREKSEPCHKLPLGNLPRRRLAGCYTYHPGEQNITDCGLGSTIRANSAIFMTTTILAISATRLFM